VNAKAGSVEKHLPLLMHDAWDEKNGTSSSIHKPWPSQRNIDIQLDTALMVLYIHGETKLICIGPPYWSRLLEKMEEIL
jgi:hypothetical protein